MSKVVEIVDNAIRKTIEDMGYEIVEIEYAKKFDNNHLTVYIDTANGVSLDDCEKVNYAVTELIDTANPTGDTPYIFNVSSPGLDRPFKTERDFIKNYGKDVEVKLYSAIDKKKSFEGTLIRKTDTEIVILDKGKERSIPLTAVAVVRQLIKFE